MEKSGILFYLLTTVGVLSVMVKVRIDMLIYVLGVLIPQVMVALL